MDLERPQRDGDRIDLPTDGRTAAVGWVQGNVPEAGLDFNAERRAVLDNHVNGTLELTDRNGIPAKRGAVSTQLDKTRARLSRFWFETLAAARPHHLLSVIDDAVKPGAKGPVPLMRWTPPFTRQRRAS